MAACFLRTATARDGSTTEAKSLTSKGIDIVAYTDPLGATGSRIKAQVKRRADKVNVDGVGAFLAVLGPHDVGIFITTGGFTRDAEREVRSQETRRITLIDMEKLLDLWVEHYASIANSDKP
jgi:restriction system protein